MVYSRITPNEIQRLQREIIAGNVPYTHYSWLPMNPSQEAVVVVPQSSVRERQISGDLSNQLTRSSGEINLWDMVLDNVVLRLLILGGAAAIGAYFAK